MFFILMLLASIPARYAAPPDTPAGVANCIRSHAEKLAASSESDLAVSEKAFAACSEPFEQMLAARDADLVKQTGSPVPEENRAEWRASMTGQFRRMALYCVATARGRR